MKLRILKKTELKIILEWTAKEGWNPALNDDIASRNADEKGCTGCFIIHHKHRNTSAGQQLCQKPHFHRNIGLDGVFERRQAYSNLGFKMSTAA